jgi:hypothetical protein
MTSRNYLQDLANPSATHEENHQVTKTIGSFSPFLLKKEGFFLKKQWKLSFKKVFDFSCLTELLLIYTVEDGNLSPTYGARVQIRLTFTSRASTGDKGCVWRSCGCGCGYGCGGVPDSLIKLELFEKRWENSFFELCNVDKMMKCP